MKKILFFLLFSTLLFSQNNNEEYQVFNDFYDNTCLSDYQIKVLNAYKNKKFVSENVFLDDLEKLVKNNIYIPSDFQAECLGYYFGIEKAEGNISELKKFTYYEIFMFAEGQCYIRDEIIKKEKPKEEKPLVLTPSHNEANQYIEVHFSKNKQGISFNEFKIVNGDNVSFNIKTTLLEQINKDFSNDKNGNYTAFYDVFYINSEPKKIKLKTRLNR